LETLDNVIVDRVIRGLNRRQLDVDGAVGLDWPDHQTSYPRFAGSVRNWHHVCRAVCIRSLTSGGEQVVL